MKKAIEIISTMIMLACLAYIIYLASQYWQARMVYDTSMFVYGFDLMVFALVSLSIIIMMSAIFANYDDDDKKGKKKKLKENKYDNKTIKTSNQRDERDLQV